MAFRFGLDSVLVHRRTLERQQAAVHARARAGTRSAERQRDDLLQARDALRADVLGGYGGAPAGELQAAHGYLRRLDGSIAAAQREVRSRATAEERARADLQSAAAERRRLEILRERRYDAFRLAAAAREEREGPLTLPVSPADDYTNAAAAASCTAAGSRPDSYHGLTQGVCGRSWRQSEFSSSMTRSSCA